MVKIYVDIVKKQMYNVLKEKAMNGKSKHNPVKREGNSKAERFPYYGMLKTTHKLHPELLGNGVCRVKTLSGL